MEKIKKVLVLGSSGMLGHVMVDILESYNTFDVHNLSRKRKINNKSIICDIINFKKLEDHINLISPDYVINCIGILIKKSQTDIKSAILINSYLPHYLESISNKFNFRLIHISSDCVFSGIKGNYNEKSKIDPIDTYGLTKSLGEIVNNNHLTIRTSIIGPELKKDGEGLLSWILKNERGNIQGYEKSIWSGLTTLELSKSIIYCIENNLTGLLHVFNNPISKYELVKLINNEFELDIQIKKVPGKTSDKSLSTLRNDFNYEIPSYSKMISEMHDFIKASNNQI